MNVIIRIIWRVELHDPVDVREIKTTLSNIGAKKDASFTLTEFEIGRCSLRLLLLAVDVLDGNINVVEEVAIEFDSVTTRHEYHDLLLQVLSKESEEESELLLRFAAYNVTLLEICDGT